MTEFTTPSGNIACGITGSGATAQIACEVKQHSWAAAPKPASCVHNWGSGWLVLDAQSVSRGLCLGGPPFAPVRSDSAFLACADLNTRHGFVVNRSDLVTYK